VSAYLDRFPVFFALSLLVAAMSLVVFPVGMLTASRVGSATISQAIQAVVVLGPPILWLVVLRNGLQRFGRRGWWLLIGAPLSFLYIGLLVLWFGGIYFCLAVKCSGFH